MVCGSFSLFSCSLCGRFLFSLFVLSCVDLDLLSSVFCFPLYVYINTGSHKKVLKNIYFIYTFKIFINNYV